jgi:P27 family predicted phage terminase small subunit
MAGRKPKPTAVKKLEGNPGKRKLNNKELDPQKRMPACPDWLMPEAKKEWERLAELMNQMDVLTEADMAAFAAYCQSYVRWKEAQEHIISGGSTFEIDIELEIKRERAKERADRLFWQIQKRHSVRKRVCGAARGVSRQMGVLH